MTSWLNAFPTTTGVSQNMSPATIVLVKSAPDVGGKTICFGQYAMFHFGTKNNMRQQSIKGIALCPSNNKKGYYFMSLCSGREIHSNNWDEMPLDDWAIRQVEKLAEQEGHPLIPDKLPLFEWSPGVTIDNIDGESEDQDPNPHMESFMATPHQVIFQDEIDEKRKEENFTNHNEKTEADNE
mmetsp:Transcript_14843/g.21240  ORF Transcript_14843/g.21240 Transcript_14843/m.21240 type:complete len:182 (+) Transcript_14843:1891-2436(+)